MAPWTRLPSAPRPPALYKPSKPSPRGALSHFLASHLLCGGWPQGLGALGARAARVAGTAHGALLLPAALRRALWESPMSVSAALPPTLPPALGPRSAGRTRSPRPLAPPPSGPEGSAQAATHGGWWLGRAGWQCAGARGAVICALTEDHAVAEARPAAGGALQLGEGCHAQWAPCSPL